MTDPMYGQPDARPAVDPWATGELRSDPTTSTPPPTTVPQQPMDRPQQPPAMRGVAPVPVAPSTPSGEWEPASYGGRGGGGLGRRAVLIAALAALAVVVGTFSFFLTNARDWFSTAATGSTSGPPSHAATSPAPTGPFAGTDAYAYAKGEDGIVVQAAAEVPGFTTAQVQSGLDKVKQALKAARLDPKMLTDHDTSGLLGLLAPDNRDFIVKAFSDKKFLGFATQLGPGQKLASDPTRVKGTMTFSPAVTDDALKARLLKIDTNIVWVYGFDGASPTPGQRMVTIKEQITWYITSDADTNIADRSRGLFLSKWHAFTYNMDCTLVRDDLIGLGQPSTVSPGPTVDLHNLLNPSSTVDAGASTC
jgi:hypothetical protein